MSVSDFLLASAQARVKGSENPASNAPSTAEMVVQTNREARVLPQNEPQTHHDLYAPSRAVHVVPYGSGWAVQEESSDILAILRTQHEALAEGRQIALASGQRIVLHRADGTVARSWTARRGEAP